MHTRDKGAVAVAALALALAGTLIQWRPPRPDVVLVVLDTLRPDHLGCYGYERPTSPVLDAFAREAVLFEQAESASPWTAPALISLVTSLYPEVHGVFSFPNPGSMNARATTLAEILQQHGYATGAFTEGGYAKGEFGLGQGFEVFPTNPGDEDSNASNMTHSSRLEENLERALAWLAAERERPRFLLFHTYEVHEPLRAPDEYVRLFRPDWDGAAEEARLTAAFERFERERAIDPADVQLLFDHKHHCLMPGDERVPDGLQQFLHENGLNPPGGGLNPGTLQFFRDQYDAEIRYTDEQLGRLFAALDPEAIVAVVSDHGEAIGEHQKIGHGSRFHREQLGVALLLRARDLAPRRVPQLVRSVDVMPTLLDLAGVHPDGLALQGQSLLPLLAGTGPGPSLSFSQALSLNNEERSRFSVRTAQHRAILDPHTGAVQLFDLAADPGETRDLAGEQPELAAELAARIREQRERDSALAPVLAGLAEAHEFTPDEEESLRELGYLGDDDE